MRRCTFGSERVDCISNTRTQADRRATEEYVASKKPELSVKYLLFDRYRVAAEIGDLWSASFPIRFTTATLWKAQCL